MIYISLIISLMITLCIEVPIAMVYRIPFQRACLVNLFTNPLVVMLILWATYLQLELLPIIVILEILVVMCEGYFYFGYCKHPLLFSLTANGCSYILGVILQQII